MGYQTITGSIGVKHKILGSLADSIGMLISQDIQEKLRIYPDKIDFLLCFPGDIVSRYIHSGKIDLNKFSIRAINGERWINHIEGRNPVYYRKFLQGFMQATDSLHLEGPKNLILFYDNKILCNVAYLPFRSGFLIHQLQGFSPKSKKMYELNEFEWQKVLVVLVEEIAKLSGMKRLFILPAIRNNWDDIRKNKNNRGETIYNQTAVDLGFRLNTERDIKKGEARSLRYVTRGETTDLFLKEFY